MKDPKPPTMSELYREMDRLRKRPHVTELTKDQKEFLRRARSGSEVVSYPDIAKLWEHAGWGKVTSEAIRGWYRRVKERD
jgi:hypothetical protein